MVFLKWFGRLIIGCCAIAAAWGTWYVVYEKSLIATAEEDTKKPKKPLAVEVASAQLGHLEERIVLVGNLLPVAQTDLRARVNGYIKNLTVDVGDRVSKGDPICWLDKEAQEAELNRAKAARDAAIAQVKVQEAARELAEKNKERTENLYNEMAGSKQELETATSNLQVAEAQLELEKARVDEAEEALKSLEVNLRDFELKAPISGFISQRLADIGDLAKPDVPLLEVVDISTVRTNVYIIEKDYQKVAEGQVADVTVDAYPGRTFQGKVTRIAPVLDQETRTAMAQIEVENSDYLLKPGMYARVSLNSERKQSGVMIPLAAVIEINGRSFVYVVNGDNKAEMKQVSLGTTDGRVVEVVDGISEGERVVTLGNRLVQPGQEVAAMDVPWSIEALLSADESVPAPEREIEEPESEVETISPVGGD